jgi:putative ATP-dependent endonuclease of OLD family
LFSASLGKFFGDLGKTVFAVFDKQKPESSAAIKAVIHHPFESNELGFENVVLLHTAEAALRRYALSLVADHAWPNHLIAKTPASRQSLEQIREALRQFFSWTKGSGDAGDLLGSCDEAEMPNYVRETLRKIHDIVEPHVPSPQLAANAPPPSGLDDLL